jgi:predicted MFS family arabinose efflux permease
MSYYEWKAAFSTRLGVVGGAFVGGMVLEALAGYSAWGILLVTFFVCLTCVGLVVACDPLLERLYDRTRRQQTGEWVDF